MTLLQDGIDSKLISISEDEKQITYWNHYRSRNFNNPE